MKINKKVKYNKIVNKRLKKIILMIFLLNVNIFSKNTSIEAKESIDKWLKEVYKIEKFNQADQTSERKEQIKSFNWISERKRNKKIVEKIRKKYPAEKFGYKIQEAMYKIEIKKKN